MTTPASDLEPILPVAPDADRRRNRLLWTVVALAVLAIALLRLGPRLRAPFLPQPVAAHVTLLPEGAAVAGDGPHELAAGTPFRLFAVLEAKTVTGATVYFTEAPALRLGGAEVPANQLRRWPAGARTVKVRWWTVEGFAPYLAVSAPEDLERLRYVESFRPEWGPAWTAEGTIDPKLVQLDPASPLRPLPFGTQRYSVRIEVYDSAAALTAAERVASPGATELVARPDRVTAATATLPPPLGRVSRAFGLPQLDPSEGLQEGLARRVDALHAAELAFERAALLRDHLEASGRGPGDLRWRLVDLAADGPRWDDDRAAGSDAAAPGDLVQGGARIVVLFRDEGERGRLDPADLVLDFHRGAKIRRLDEVFAEAGAFELEWAPLTADATAAASGSTRTSRRGPW